MGKYVDWTDQRFGRLTVLKKDESNKELAIKWVCLCDCGNTTIVRRGDLTSGKTLSCGCIRKEGRHRTHNLSDTRLYRIWVNIKTRCTNEKSPQYKNYGFRGIKICEEWANSFEAFYTWAMENGYDDNLTIDRIDVNGNYEPCNCRWATRKEQSLNRTDNRRLTYKGETKTFAEWSEITGIHRETIKSRLKAGLTIEQALTKAP